MHFLPAIAWMIFFAGGRSSGHVPEGDINLAVAGVQKVRRGDETSRMDDFAVDLDKVLDDFELSEGQFDFPCGTSEAQLGQDWTDIRIYMYI